MPAAAAAAGALAALLAPSATRAEPYLTAVLRGLDKVTARTTTIEAPVGVPVRFGTLQITTEACDKRPPEETPESAAFLVILDDRPAQTASTVFSGWMFASSPGLSALQHPVYDVWVLDCANKAAKAEESESPGGSP